MLRRNYRSSLKNATAVIGDLDSNPCSAFWTGRQFPLTFLVKEVTGNQGVKRFSNASGKQEYCSHAIPFLLKSLYGR